MQQRWFLLMLVLFRHVLSDESARTKMTCEPGKKIQFKGSLLSSDTAQFPFSVAAADMNGDGFLDVCAASFKDDSIRCWKNKGDQRYELFDDDPILVTASADGAFGVSACDADGDNDIDLWSASFYDDSIRVFENIDGSGEHWKSHLVFKGADGADSIFCIDRNGKADAFSTSERDDSVRYHRNLGDWEFETELVSNRADGAWSVFAVDYDSDNDIDAISGSEYVFLFKIIIIQIHNRRDDTIRWHEHTRHGWTSHTITDSADDTYGVWAGDIDGDSRSEILSASFFDDTVKWYKRIDDGNYKTEPITITKNADGAQHVSTADIDGDSALDALVCSANDGKISWHRNLDGSATSFKEYVVTTDAHFTTSVLAADFDNDSRLDILTVAPTENRIILYYQRCVDDHGIDNKQKNFFTNNLVLFVLLTILLTCISLPLLYFAMILIRRRGCANSRASQAENSHHTAGIEQFYELTLPSSSSSSRHNRAQQWLPTPFSSSSFRHSSDFQSTRALVVRNQGEEITHSSNPAADDDGDVHERTFV